MNKYPNNAKFAVCLTHDIDRVKKTHQYFTRFVRFLKRKHIRAAVNEIYNFFRFYFSDIKKDPYWPGRIIDIEGKLGVKSTFFFLNETKKTNWFNPKEWKLSFGRYKIDDPGVVEFIKRIDNEGWEVGLHGSYDSYKDKNLLSKEKEKLEGILGKEIYGIRQHYLNLNIPETWKIQKELGIKYDSSFGSVNEFVNDKPFHPFDDANFLVIPLVIMDTGLFSKNDDIEFIFKKFKKLIDIVEKENGVITLNWHYYNEYEFPGEAKLYRKIIDICKEKGAWIATCSDVVQWINKK